MRNLQSAAAEDMQLGNTTQLDRPLLREIPDQEVFAPATRSSANNTGDHRQTFNGAPGRRLPASIWQVVGQSKRITVPENQLVNYYRQQYAEEAFWISKILRRASPFAGYIVEALDERYLPVELALLPAIESSYRPYVHSNRDAAGLWQFIPSTAKEIGVPFTAWFDGRKDIRMATAASIHYLSYLNAKFNGDWLLTLAAYNGGPGRVQRAIAANQRRGLPLDYWSLRLPEETRHYVPKFLALLATVRNHQNVPGLTVPVVAPGAAFDIVDVGRRTSLRRVSELTTLPMQTLRHLNAALIQEVTPPNGPHEVYVPPGFGQLLVDAVKRLPRQSQLAEVYKHTVVPGDTIGKLARKYGLTDQRLLEINSLTDDKILVGQILLTEADTDEIHSSFKYVVAIDDTLSEISARFSIPLSNIRDEQGKRLDSDVIHPGDVLSLQKTGDGHHLP
ncbi:MAG: transglycosylase SLT domain-containing protein [Granulosicoccus sp.]